MLIPKNQNQAYRASKKSTRQTRGKTNTLVNLTSQPTYDGATVVKMTLQGSPDTLATAASTGVINKSTGLSFGLISAYSSRGFAVLFDEGRLLSVKVLLYPLANTSGTTSFFFSEKSIGVPTLSESIQRKTRVLVNSNGTGNSMYSMTWKADSFADLVWDPASSTSPAAYFNVYTDGPNYGAPTTATNLWLIKYELTVQFRGIAST